MEFLSCHRCDHEHCPYGTPAHVDDCEKDPNIDWTFGEDEYAMWNDSDYIIIDLSEDGNPEAKAISEKIRKEYR